MVDQLVLGFERSLLSGTTSPVAGIVCHLRTANMVDGQVVYHLVHGVVDLLAELPGVPVHPLTGHLLLDRLLPHVPVVGGHVAIAHVAVAVVASRGSHQGSTVRVCGSSCVERGGEHGVVGGVGEVARVGGAKIGSLWITREALHLERGAGLSHHHGCHASFPFSPACSILREQHSVSGQSLLTVVR